MIKSIFALSLFVLFCFSLTISKAQTLIINEVSNGPTGNQEYMEFAVVSNSVTYNCNGGALPTIDIRGWIFDDNSGYHGTSGIAAGALRFAYNPLWANVPLGTIILIYNDADPNPNIPSNDLSLTDGNCRLIIPVSSNLIEKNTTTPGAVSCSYPTTPSWTSGGDWTFDVLANGGDCARLVNLAGCEVFSVCYGTDNLNNLIYFSGNGGQTVYYFNGSDPTNQNNWSSGVAAATGSAETPGAANNATNANYINQFNNSCSVITPLNLTTNSITPANCICDGSASLNATGGLGNYSYQWFDGNFNLLGNTSASSNTLCAGNYSVIVSTSIGNCKDTVSFTINSNPTTVANFSGINSNVVALGTTINLNNTSINATSYEWLTCTGNSTSTNYAITFNTVGTCCIKLVAKNNGCNDTITTCVNVTEDIVKESNIYIPNVFTPNGDNVNDVFLITFSDIKNMTLSIYNRWGNLIHTASNTLPTSIAWDGATTSGTKASSGTYFYVIDYIDLADKPFKQKGFFSLFKN